MDRRALSLALVLVACGSSDPTPPPSTVTAPPVTVAPPSSVAPPPSSTAPATPVSVAPRPAAPAPLTAAQRTEARDAVRQGRAALHESRFVDALAAFQRAVAIDQSNRRLRCEAGYVAHLGGDEAQAETLIGAALSGMPEVSAVADDLRVPYAQCLYNAGLVYQATGATDDAREAWTDSLTLRPNATVQTHLDALPPRTTDEQGNPLLALRPEMTDVEVGDALFAHYQDEADADGVTEEEDEEEDDDEEEEHAHVVVTPIAADAGVPADGVSAALFAFDPDYQRHEVVLVVRAGGHIAAFQVLEVFNPGALGIWADGDVDHASLTDVAPGGLPEIVLRTHDGSSDDDLGGCVSYQDANQDIVVCSITPTIACAAVALEHHTEESCDPECIREWDEHCGRDGRPRAAGRVATPLSASVSFDAGHVVVDVESDADHGLPASLAGTHDLAAFLRLAPLDAL